MIVHNISAVRELAIPIGAIALNALVLACTNTMRLLGHNHKYTQWERW